MPQRAKRLAPVISLAERAEREAARQLGQCQGLSGQAQSKLNDLEGYRSDYQQQWLSEGQHGVSGQWLMNYQRFLAQLEVAVSQQRQTLAWHQDNLNKARTLWQARYARLEGLRKLVERYAEESRQIEAKREQKLFDELSQQMRAHDQD